jgi:hypothetical protein
VSSQGFSFFFFFAIMSWDHTACCTMVIMQYEDIVKPTINV